MKLVRSAESIFRKNFLFKGKRQGSIEIPLTAVKLAGDTFRPLKVSVLIEGNFYLQY